MIGLFRDFEVFMNYLRFLAVFAVFVLAGCGFRPLYGDHSASTSAAVRASLNDIYIGNIPTSPGSSCVTR